MTDTTERECVACGKTKHTDDETDNLCECGGPMSNDCTRQHMFKCVGCGLRHWRDAFNDSHPCDHCGCAIVYTAETRPMLEPRQRAAIAGGGPMPASQLTPPRMGWVCSKCERSLAPHVEECPCSAKGYSKGEDTPSLYDTAAIARLRAKHKGG